MQGGPQETKNMELQNSCKRLNFLAQNICLDISFTALQCSLLLQPKRSTWPNSEMNQKILPIHGVICWARNLCLILHVLHYYKFWLPYSLCMKTLKQSSPHNNRMWKYLELFPFQWIKLEIHKKGPFSTPFDNEFSIINFFTSNYKKLGFILASSMKKWPHFKDHIIKVPHKQLPLIPIGKMYWQNL